MASNDLRGENEYAYSLNVANLDRVYEIKFLAKIGHFSVKRVQTGNKHRFYIYRYGDKRTIKNSLRKVVMILNEQMCKSFNKAENCETSCEVIPAPEIKAHT